MQTNALPRWFECINKYYNEHANKEMQMILVSCVGEVSIIN